MADTSSGGLASLKGAILNWLMPHPNRAAAEAMGGDGKTADPPAEPDRGELGEGRGRVLYIRA